MLHAREWHRVVADSLRLLIRSSRSYVDENLRRLGLMHKAYLNTNAHLYLEGEIGQIQHYLDALAHKYWLATISVEQLQAVRHNKVNEGILSALEHSLDSLDCSEDEKLLVSFALECFLFESVAFLHLYMIYVCLLLRTGQRGRITRDRFFGELAKVNQGPLAEKARWVEDYFNLQVFGTHSEHSLVREDWGELVMSLRDKIAHSDILRPSLDSEETLVKGILLDWPTLQDMTYHSFCEMIRSGMYFLFYDVSAFLCELNWDDFHRAKS